jgi:mRNA-degrading endonuclease RelE of RelBE toxin-antitoxin system
MPYRIEFVAGATVDLRALRKTDRVKALDRIERHLTHQPTLRGRSRIKRLRSGTFPPYRLRVEDLRVYYDVDERRQVVVILGIVPKAQSVAWLDRAAAEHRRGEDA